jgi:hypothetical protein
LDWERSRSTAGVSGGWGEKGSETENYQSHEKRFKNAQSPSRPGRFVGCFLLQLRQVQITSFAIILKLYYLLLQFFHYRPLHSS